MGAVDRQDGGDCSLKFRSLDAMKQPDECTAAPTDEEWREVFRALARMSAAEQEIFLQYVRQVANGMGRAQAARLLWSETAALRMH